MQKDILFILTFLTIFLSTKELNLRRLDDNNSISNSAKAAYIYTSTETLTSETKTTSTTDTSIIKVSSPGVLTISGGEYTKTGGDSSNTENSEFYGINAGILVTTGATCTINNQATIKTNAKGSNAVFATGSNAKVILNDVTIITSNESSSRGLDATYGGSISGTNVNIKTQGGSCATLATDRGEGTVSCDKCILETNGKGSPLIYSTGAITLTNSQGNSKGSQFVVVEGKNSALVKSSTLISSGAGNRGTVDVCGVMIYQSMSGDANEGKGTFTCSDSTSLTINSDSEYYNTAPFFFVTNTDAEINLKGCTLIYGSNTLMKIAGTSEWGTSGSNGGVVTFTIEGQEVKGDIVIDNVSNITIILKNNAKLTGAINNANTAAGVSISIDSTSSWVLTANSFISKIEGEDKITKGDYIYTLFARKEITRSSGGNGGNPPGDNPQGGNPPGDNPPGNNPPGDKPLGDNPQGGNSTYSNTSINSSNNSSTESGISSNIKFNSYLIYSLLIILFII